jgi:hypothetical protein
VVGVSRRTRLARLGLRAGVLTASAILVVSTGASAAPAGSPRPDLASLATARSSPGPSAPHSGWVADPHALPVPAGDVYTTPGPKGGVYVLVADPGESREAGRGSRSVLALLNAAGRVRIGWPISIEGWSCDAAGIEAWDPQILQETESLARTPVFVLCRADARSPAVGTLRAYAFNETAGLLPGWPVDLSSASLGGGSIEGSRATGDGFSLLLHDAADCDCAGRWRTARIDHDGTLRLGTAYDAPPASDASGYGEPGPARLGPDGNGYVWQRHGALTEVASFGPSGLRAGWPLTIPETDVVDLVFGDEGYGFVFVVARIAGGAATRVRGFRSNAQERYGAPADVPVRVGTAYGGGGPNVYTVFIGGDYSAWILGSRGGRTYVYALDRVGHQRKGWPYRVVPGPQWQFPCTPPVTPCANWLAWPAVGPGNVLYLPVAASSDRAGGKLVAVARPGRVVAGWPVTLRRSGAQFLSVGVGPDGTIFGLAAEPEAKGGWSATVLAIAPNGKTRWSKTVVEP